MLTVKHAERGKSGITRGSAATAAAVPAMESGLKVTDVLQTPVERVGNRTDIKNPNAVSCHKLGYVQRKIKFVLT